jgi:hypothetical protein
MLKIKRPTSGALLLGFFLGLIAFSALANGLTAVTGGYPFSVTSLGLPSDENFSITVSPNSNSVGAPGGLYVFSIARNGSVWSFGPTTGWQQTSPANPANTNGIPSISVFRKLKVYSYFNSLPATLSVTPLTNAPVSEQIGKVIYAGYGTNPAQMYRNGTYSAVSTEMPRTQNKGLTVCKNTRFALCASSVCTALTGQTVTNNQGLTYPAASCVCPIVQADNIADLKAGNQVGSCISPDPAYIYSTFAPLSSYPQQVNGVWTANVPAATPNVCDGKQSTVYYAQCWNWKCSLIAPQNGIELASCTCPMQTANFWVEGSVNNPCSSIPVGAALNKDAYDPTNY